MKTQYVGTSARLFYFLVRFRKVVTPDCRSELLTFYGITRLVWVAGAIAIAMFHRYAVPLPFLPIWFVMWAVLEGNIFIYEFGGDEKC